LDIYDAIHTLGGIEHILVRHEQAAAHAADGYARVSGKVGVALVTSGPGFTNAITGLATAYSDSIPIVLISGQVPTFMIGTDAFQEIDAVGISRPCVKHNFLVKSIEELPRIIKEAFYIARRFYHILPQNNRYLSLDTLFAFIFNVSDYLYSLSTTNHYLSKTYWLSNNYSSSRKKI